MKNRYSTAITHATTRLIKKEDFKKTIMNKIKKLTINAALECYSKIYIHANPHPELAIGRRGLVGDEQNNGIVLAISSTSCSDFEMTEDRFTAQMRFAGSWEDVFVPLEAIDAILDELSMPEYVVNFPRSLRKPVKKEPKPEKTGGKIVKLDFNKKK